MKKLSAIAIGDKVLVSYDIPFKNHIPEEFSFSCFFDIDEYKSKLEKIKNGDSVIFDGKNGKLQVTKKDDLYEIQLIPDPILINLKSCNPYKDLQI